jgi:hypothetical protein
MAQTNKKSKVGPSEAQTNKKGQKASTGKSSSTSSDPKTPVLAKGAPSASKGRPPKRSAKENEDALVSPLGRPGAPSSDTATGDDVPTSVAEENRILRERLAKAECEWDIPFSLKSNTPL